MAAATPTAADTGAVAVSLDGPVLTRDLEVARKAYASSDPALSRAAHEGTTVSAAGSAAKESHGGCVVVPTVPSPIARPLVA
jgi:hypothetical protein